LQEDNVNPSFPSDSDPQNHDQQDQDEEFRKRLEALRLLRSLLSGKVQLPTGIPHVETQQEVGLDEQAEVISREALEENCPPLPQDARLPERAGVDASGWLDGYIAFSKQWSLLAYEGFHEAIGLWVLSTLAARRVTLSMGNQLYTPLFIALVARTGLYAKSTTTGIGRDVLRSANLDWLLTADDATPQKFISDLAGGLPANYEELTIEQQERVRWRLALAGQHGWYYKALRIAMLLASLENAGRIELRHWARGQEICERWRADLHTLVGLLNGRVSGDEKLLEKKVLQIIERLGLVTVREVKQRVTGVDTMKIRSILDGLVQAGILEAVGTGRTVRYRLSLGSGWQSLWKGWFSLQALLEGVHLAAQLPFDLDST
jgi:hypothetical protein